MSSSAARAQVIVDTVTFVVCRAVGLQVDGESVPYVAGWAKAAHWTRRSSSPRRSTRSRGASRQTEDEVTAP